MELLPYQVLLILVLLQFLSNLSWLYLPFQRQSKPTPTLLYTLVALYGREEILSVLSRLISSFLLLSPPNLFMTFVHLGVHGLSLLFCERQSP